MEQTSNINAEKPAVRSVRFMSDLHRIAGVRCMRAAGYDGKRARSIAAGAGRTVNRRGPRSRLGPHPEEQPMSETMQKTAAKGAPSTAAGFETKAWAAGSPTASLAPATIKRRATG